MTQIHLQQFIRKCLVAGREQDIQEARLFYNKGWLEVKEMANGKKLLCIIKTKVDGVTLPEMTVVNLPDLLKLSSGLADEFTMTLEDDELIMTGDGVEGVKQTQGNDDLHLAPIPAITQIPIFEYDQHLLLADFQRDLTVAVAEGSQYTQICKYARYCGTIDMIRYHNHLFNIETLQRILKANSEYTYMHLRISQVGLAVISFDYHWRGFVDETYYLVDTKAANRP